LAGLPTGTVTFLVTDLEGSARLWDEAVSPQVLAPGCGVVGVRAEVAAALGAEQYARLHAEGLMIDKDALTDDVTVELDALEVGSERDVG
jgi:hypothetical protein